MLVPGLIEPYSTGQNLFVTLSQSHTRHVLLMSSLCCCPHPRPPFLHTDSTREHVTFSVPLRKKLFLSPPVCYFSSRRHPESACIPTERRDQPCTMTPTVSGCCHALGAGWVRQPQFVSSDHREAVHDHTLCNTPRDTIPTKPAESSALVQTTQLRLSVRNQSLPPLYRVCHISEFTNMLIVLEC